MTDTQSTSGKLDHPAVTTLSNLDCQLGPEGMATLSAVITVAIFPRVETIERIEVFVNNIAATGNLTEQAGSPTTDPGAGVETHTYDWDDVATCGETYSVRAVATIVMHTTAPSGGKSVTCPACP